MQARARRKTCMVAYRIPGLLLMGMSAFGAVNVTGYPNDASRDSSLTAHAVASSVQGEFTNSALLRSAVAGTNLSLSYSLTTTQGWVTLLRSDSLPGLVTNPQPVTFAAAPFSLQGQFLFPINRSIRSQFYRLLLEP
jgi:hypothetical protein